QDLRLHDDLAAELLGGGARLLGRRREASLGHGDAEAPEELLALVLVEVHRRASLLARVVRAGTSPSGSLPYRSSRPNPRAGRVGAPEVPRRPDCRGRSRAVRGGTWRRWA